MNALTFYRIGRWCYVRRIPFMPGLVYRLNRLVFSCSIPVSAEIGEGTTLAYGGMGVVIHGRCRIGRRVVIGHQVSVGGRSPRIGVPVIEDDCYIGPGSMVLGPIRVGAGSIVGPNAVVIEDVPPRTVVVGVPARIIRSGIDIEAYRRADGPIGIPHSSA